MSWVIPRKQNPIRASLSLPFSFEDPRVPPQPAGDYMVPGHTAAMTHTSAGSCFSISYSFLYPLASSLDQVSCTPKPWGLRVFRDLCTVPRVPFDRK